MDYYELGRISGILEGFSYVNNKTNHGFTFEIYELDQAKSIEESSAYFLKSMYPESEISFKPIVAWEALLSSYFERWLFSYLPQKNKKGDIVNAPILKDINNNFNMSDSYFRKDIITELCKSLKSNLSVTRAVEVRLKTKGWYECDWNDIALEGENGNIFIHLGVSD